MINLTILSENLQLFSSPSLPEIPDFHFEDPDLYPSLILSDPEHWWKQDLTHLLLYFIFSGGWAEHPGGGLRQQPHCGGQGATAGPPSPREDSCVWPVSGNQASLQRCCGSAEILLRIQIKGFISMWISFLDFGFRFRMGSRLI